VSHRPPSIEAHPLISVRALEPGWLSATALMSGYDIYALRGGSSLRPEVEKWLVTALSDAMPELKIPAYFAARPAALSSADHMTVAVGGTPPGLKAFLCSRWYADDTGGCFLHASICLITKEHRQTFLFRNVWGRHLEQVDDGGLGFPYVIALKTYNPGVYSILSAFTRFEGVTLYPRIDGPQDESRRDDICFIQDRIAARLPFDWTSGVIRGAGVPPDFYPELPDHRRTEVCDYFRRHLLPGDRLLCVLTFPRQPGLRQRVLGMFGAIPGAAPNRDTGDGVDPGWQLR
jgi:hypothetical protein